MPRGWAVTQRPRGGSQPAYCLRCSCRRPLDWRRYLHPITHGCLQRPLQHLAAVHQLWRRLCGSIRRTVIGGRADGQVEFEAECSFAIISSLWHSMCLVQSEAPNGLLAKVITARQAHWYGPSFHRAFAHRRLIGSLRGLRPRHCARLPGQCSLLPESWAATSPCARCTNCLAQVASAPAASSV